MFETHIILAKTLDVWNLILSTHKMGIWIVENTKGRNKTYMHFHNMEIGVECQEGGGHGQVIPKQLCENAIDVLNKLCQKHSQGISSIHECGEITTI